MLPLLAAVAFIGALATVAVANPLEPSQANLGLALVILVLLGALYEAVVILTEAIGYLLILKLRFRQALGYSAIANIASLLAGLAVIPLGAPGRFAVALAVEVPVLYLLMLNRRRIGGEDFSPGLVVFAAVAVNVVTHGLTYLATPLLR